MRDDDICWIGNTPYCSNCVSRCEECDNYTTSELTEVIVGGRNRIWMCDSCVDIHAELCSRCGMYCLATSSVEIGENTFCYACAEEVGEAC